jgi:SOS-response transcriptional repressor LexA
VIAEIDGEYIFRQFVQEGDQYMLKAVNEGYPVTQLDDVSVVRGVVTQRAGTRRTYHKHYD